MTKNWNQREHPNKCVSVYFAPGFLDELDELCEQLSVRRNDFIKEAIRQKMLSDQMALQLSKGIDRNG